MKRDANPGEITRMWFQTKPATAGLYQVTCAEICGYAHYLMQAKFEVMKPKDFDNWIQEAARWSEIGYEANKPEQHWGWDWKPTPSAQIMPLAVMPLAVMPLAVMPLAVMPLAVMPPAVMS